MHCIVQSKCLPWNSGILVVSQMTWASLLLMYLWWFLRLVHITMARTNWFAYLRCARIAQHAIPIIDLVSYLHRFCENPCNCIQGNFCNSIYWHTDKKNQSPTVQSAPNRINADLILLSRTRVQQSSPSLTEWMLIGYCFQEPESNSPVRS